MAATLHTRAVRKGCGNSGGSFSSLRIAHLLGGGSAAPDDGVYLWLVGGVCRRSLGGRRLWAGLSVDCVVGGGALQQEEEEEEQIGRCG